MMIVVEMIAQEGVEAVVKVGGVREVGAQTTIRTTTQGLRREGRIPRDGRPRSEGDVGAI